MAAIDISALDPGDELGSNEIPQCCEVLTDKYPTGFQCGQCDSFVSVDATRTVTYVEIN